MGGTLDRKSIAEPSMKTSVRLRPNRGGQALSHADRTEAEVLV
jgi:hypothetical protein